MVGSSRKTCGGQISWPKPKWQKSTSCLAPRKEFLSLAVPVTIQGMGGPGAPHQFDVSRREDLGSSAPLMLMSFTFHSVHVVSDLC